MSIAENNLKDARDQLALILSFFPRVDAKLSTLLAIDNRVCGEGAIAHRAEEIGDEPLCGRCENSIHGFSAILRAVDPDLQVPIWVVA